MTVKTGLVTGVTITGLKSISQHSARVFRLIRHVGLDIAEYISEKKFNYVNQDYTLSLGYIPNERLEFSLGAGYAVYND